MDALSQDLLEEAIRNTEDLLQHLESERSTIDKRITDVRESLARLMAAKTSPQNGQAVSQGRRRKGENTRTVLALFDKDPAAALTKQEIADRAQIAFSSVQSVLDVLAKDEESGLYLEGGLWRRRRKVAGQVGGREAAS